MPPGIIKTPNLSVRYISQANNANQPRKLKRSEQIQLNIAHINANALIKQADAFNAQAKATRHVGIFAAIITAIGIYVSSRDKALKEKLELSEEKCKDQAITNDAHETKIKKLEDEIRDLKDRQTENSQLIEALYEGINKRDNVIETLIKQKQEATAIIDNQRKQIELIMQKNNMALGFWTQTHKPSYQPAKEIAQTHNSLWQKITLK